MDPRSAFIKRFGDLVAMLRVDPGNDAAQDLALTAAAAAVADHAVVVESGVEHGSGPEDLTLTGRLRARRVDLLRVGAGATPEELLRLARALSHDATPVPSTPRLRVEMAPVVVPGELALVGREASGAARDESDRRCWRDRRHWRPDPWLQPERRRGGDRRVTGERRLRVLKHYEADIGRLQDRLTSAVADAAWREALDAAHNLFLYAARVPAAERRSFMIAARRFVSRPAFAAFIGLGLKDPTEQGRVVDVLRWSGLDGADAMIDAIRTSPAVGPRKFLHRALAAMPEAYTTVLPLLASPEPHEVSLAVSILGQMGRPEAVGALKAQLGHDNPDVRRAVLAALSTFPPHDVEETLGAVLGHPSAVTRAAAADAIGRAGATALAMPLAAALGSERDTAAWRAMIRALGMLATGEACAALVAVALARRSLFGRTGYSRGRRLEAVRALATVAAPCRDPALQRLAREADEPVRNAAQVALDRVARAAG